MTHEQAVCRVKEIFRGLSRTTGVRTNLNVQVSLAFLRALEHFNFPPAQWIDHDYAGLSIGLGKHCSGDYVMARLTASVFMVQVGSSPIPFVEFVKSADYADLSRKVRELCVDGGD